MSKPNVVTTRQPRPAPTWKCEYCGRFFSERTAQAHVPCQQEQDRKDAEGSWIGKKASDE